MKKIHLLSIFFLLAAVSVALSSCGSSDEPSMTDDTDHRLTEWIEPYVVMRGSVDDAKAYMSAYQPRFVLSSVNDYNNSCSLIYEAKDKHNLMLSYSFLNGGLYSVIDAEYAVNLDLILDCLKKKYLMTSVTPDDTSALKCLYKFTNEQKTLEIKIVEVSKDAVSVMYYRK